MLLTRDLGRPFLMSTPELDRVTVLQRVLVRRLTQKKAGELLSVSKRQAWRRFGAFKRGGAEAMASKRRGRRSNHRLPDAMRDRALELVGLVAGS